MSRLIDDAITRADSLRAVGKLEEAAAALDAVCADDRARVLPLLRALLEDLAVDELGMRWRYVPRGTFRMGDDVGEPDERPAHDVTLGAFWMSEAPLSWADFARVLGWAPPPSAPDEAQLAQLGVDHFTWFNDGKIRLQYCENETLRARDWHAHGGALVYPDNPELAAANAEAFGYVERDNRFAPPGYDQKPVVAVSWECARQVASLVTSAHGAGRVVYSLPTEAEWERAARGCFRDADYPWGDAQPDDTRADFGHFGKFMIRPSRAFAPNDYGLFSMAGGVWEWCLDHYDAGFYEERIPAAPLCTLADDVPSRLRVIRGGSWADDAEALRVSFRSASDDGSTPNIGMRLVRRRV